MKKHLPLVLLLLITTAFVSKLAAIGKHLPENVQQISQQVRTQFTPDKRVALFDVDYRVSGKSIQCRLVKTPS